MGIVLMLQLHLVRLHLLQQLPLHQLFWYHLLGEPPCWEYTVRHERCGHSVGHLTPCVLRQAWEQRRTLSLGSGPISVAIIPLRLFIRDAHCFEHTVWFQHSSRVCVSVSTQRR